MYTTDDLEDLFDIMKDPMYSPCVRAQAETYISILQDERIALGFIVEGDTDCETLLEDTFERAMMFVELTDNGETHVWYDRVKGVRSDV